MDAPTPGELAHGARGSGGSSLRLAGRQAVFPELQLQHEHARVHRRLDDALPWTPHSRTYETHAPHECT